MRYFAAFIYSLFIVFTINAQFGKSTNLPIQDIHFGGGLHSAIPTGDFTITAFNSNEAFVVDQTLLSEWNNPSLGGYFDVSVNLSENSPFFIGYQFNRQTIFKDQIHPTSLDPKFPDLGMNYLLSKKANLTNNQFFAEAFLYGHDKFHLYGRGSIGWSTYRERNKVHAVGGYSSHAVMESTQRVFSADLGLSLRYQVNNRFGLRFFAGYQFQGANSFKRESYFSGLGATMTEDVTDFYNHDITGGSDLVRPILPRNQYLYFQVGLVHQFDGRNFFYSLTEKGEPIIAEKPVLYLYPEKEIQVNVQLNLDDKHSIAHAYPHYNKNGWNVIAKPNGELLDPSTDRKYYCLFWETKGPLIEENLQEGFLVKGDQTRDFLEEKLDELGLNQIEANEFLIYWLPRMEVNKYNAIHFAFESYEAVSELQITPKPETLIRLMMLYEPIESPIAINPQKLPEAPKRSGFVAVEWGGMEGQFFTNNRIQ